MSHLQLRVVESLLDQVDALKRENAALREKAALATSPAPVPLSPAMLGYWPAFEPARAPGTASDPENDSQIHNQ